MISHFNPNQEMAKEFLRVATASRSKIKLYLLKKAGLSSHDIRLITNETMPITLTQPEPMGDFFYNRLCYRSARNTKFHIVNASGTSPVILEIHFFVSIPDEVPIYVSTGTGYERTLKKDFTERKTFLDDSEKNVFGLFSVPVLEKGKVISVSENSFGPSLGPRVDATIDEKLGNEKDYFPPQTLTDEWNEAYVSFMRHFEVWVGLILDNEELLPYKWNHESQRFVEGFFTDATVVV